MLSSLKKNIKIIVFGLVILFGCGCPAINQTQAINSDIKYDNYVRNLDTWVINPKDKFRVNANSGLDTNILSLFYPSKYGRNAIYEVIKDMTLGVMIVFIVRAGASILFNRKPDDVKKTLWSLVYILVGGLFIYGANWIFGDVLSFNRTDTFAVGDGIQGVERATNEVFFVFLSALKAFAFFLAIIMIVITGFKVIAAGEGEKGKKLVKGLINVVFALMIIKGIDFIYYIAEDTGNFVRNASEFIINVAKVFAYIYGVIIVLMVIIAGYLYITDGGSGNNFKKATNILINILLSGLVLFAFLLILYQVFAEFQTGGDAVSEGTSFIIKNYV